MKIEVSDIECFSQPIVGNVYSINGGYGRKAGHLMVLMAITKQQAALLVVIDKDGDPVGVTSYGLHALEERAPVAFVPGLENQIYKMESLK